MRLQAGLIAEHIRSHLYSYIALVAIVLFGFPVLLELVQDWMRDDNYSHGFFIIPISVYLLYRQRAEMSFPARPSRLGIMIFIFGCIGTILGAAASEFFTTRLSLVLMVTGLALYYMGAQNFRKVWFAFFYLVFMIPIPAIIYHSATLPMQLMASKVTVGMLSVIGVPVVRAGNIINLPEYSLEVVEACSGLRSLVTLLALGALYAYLRLPGRVLPVLLFIATVPIAVATNVFRIFVTAIGAYSISRELAEDFLHEISGILVFFTALILMLIVSSVILWIRNRFRSS